MPVLSEIKPGQAVNVVRASGGREFVRRLAELGIYTGTTMRVIRGSGPMIVEVRGHRLVIGHGMVGRIVVEIADQTTAAGPVTGG